MIASTVALIAKSARRGIEVNVEKFVSGHE
jgi:hypothetical protein